MITNYNYSVMDELTKLNNQTSGRDKLFRLVQYTSKIVYHAMSCRRSRTCQDNALKVKRLDETLGLMRRLLRWGRFLESLQSALQVMSSVTDPVIRFCCVLSRISSACFMLIDHIVCLDKLGLLKSNLIDSAKWDRTSTKFWLYSITLGLVRDFYEMRRIYKEDFGVTSRKSQRSSQIKNNQKRLSSEGEGESEGGGLNKMRRRRRWGLSLEQFVTLGEILEEAGLIWRCLKEHTDVAVDTLKNCCDIWLPLNSLGVVKLSTGTVGLLGVVSTVASVMPQINPMIKMVPAT